jgi:outer membrane biogenesis lipoprotein LolB
VGVVTGPEHYAEAERLLAEVTGVDVPVAQATAIFAAAQVHADLAQVAATVASRRKASLNTVEDGETVDTLDPDGSIGWYEVCGA